MSFCLLGRKMGRFFVFSQSFFFEWGHPRRTVCVKTYTEPSPPPAMPRAAAAAGETPCFVHSHRTERERERMRERERTSCVTMRVLFSCFVFDVWVDANFQQKKRRRLPEDFRSIRTAFIAFFSCQKKEKRKKKKLKKAKAVCINILNFNWVWPPLIF